MVILNVLSNLMLLGYAILHNCYADWVFTLGVRVLYIGATLYVVLMLLLFFATMLLKNKDIKKELSWDVIRLAVFVVLWIFYAGKGSSLLNVPILFVTFIAAIETLIFDIYRMKQAS